MPASRPLRDRLLSRLDRTGPCWIWTGATRPNGYGVIGVAGNRVESVHRVAYSLFVGPIPDGLHIDHLCRVRACCRPEHLEAVEQAENNRRAWVTRKRDQCKRGHEYTAANTVQTPRGRNCRECRNAGVRRVRAERKAAGR